jgi:hypothetical protein
MSQQRLPTPIQSNADAKTDCYKKQLLIEVVGEKSAVNEWEDRVMVGEISPVAGVSGELHVNPGTW